MAGQFNITITGMGNHGCDRHSLEGEKLRTRCNRLTCVDCLTFDFVQSLRQKGFRLSDAEFTHHAGAVDPAQIVVDDLLLNQRKHGQF
jgi:hypothetical protein